MSTDLEGWYMGKYKSVPVLEMPGGWGISEGHFEVGCWEFDRKFTFTEQVEKVIAVNNLCRTARGEERDNEEEFRRDAKDFEAEALRRKLPIHSYWV